jgi:HTH-type transcriptional regulator, cell division transcriptional repressor
MNFRDESSIGGRITIARQRLNLTQKDVADKLGVSRPAVATWENNYVEPKRKIVITLAELLDVSPSYLVDGDGDRGGNVTRPSFDQAVATITGRKWSATEAAALKALIDVSTQVVA